MHFIQLQILKKLLFSEELKYSELRAFEGLENNLLTFHIDQLLKEKLVEKTESKKYKLTKKGKEFANMMDTDTSQMKKQGKISGLQCCIRDIDSNDPQLLVYTRKKHPFYNAQGYASGKIWFGEKVTNSVKRELKEETNLEGNPELFKVKHYLVYDKVSKELLEDKYFYFCRIIEPKGKLEGNDEGLFEWIRRSELKNYYKKPVEPVDILIKIWDEAINFQGQITFEETEDFVDNF